MRPTLLVTAADATLPELLRSSRIPATFTTAEGLTSALDLKAVPLLLLVDETQVPLLLTSRRQDLRAVVLVSPQPVPAIFPAPVVAVVERPLEANRLLMGIRKALETFRPTS